MPQTTASTTEFCRCSRCGRPLKNVKAIAAGMGRVCAKKATQEAALLAGVVSLPVLTEVVAPETISELAPEVAPLPMVAEVPAVAPFTRRSGLFAGLVLEFDGAGQLTFRKGTWFETYLLVGGQAINVDCSDRGSVPLTVYRHIGAVARSYARKLAPKVVA